MFFSPLERMIAFRYLRSRRKEGFISVIAGFSFIGIALGVATLIIVMAVMNGFRAEITGKILGFSGDITVSSFEGRIENYAEVAEKIAGIEGVVRAVPMINGQVMATVDGHATGALVKALRKEDMMQRPLVTNHLIGGSLEAFEGRDVVILGSQLAINLGLFIGDSLTLVSPQGRATAIGTVPRMKTYTVLATVDSGMYEYDSTTVYMPLEAGQVFFQYPESVSAIEVDTADPYQVKKTGGRIIAALEGQYSVQDWQMVNAGLFNALKVERTVMFLILTLIVFIAAFNIISSLIMLVNDKSRDIAILRTMGATRGSVMRVFFLCGSSIGVVGTLLGFLAGIGFASNIETIRGYLEKLLGTKLFDPVIYFLSELPSDIQAADVIWALAMGLSFSFLATVYPAWKASKQDPAEVLRYE